MSDSSVKTSVASTVIGNASMGVSHHIANSSPTRNSGPADMEASMAPPT
ncbi:MAG: hypothetical protein ABI471_08335 [Sphingomonas bacterium]